MPPDQSKPDQFWKWFAVIVLVLVAVPLWLGLLGFSVGIVVPRIVAAYNRARSEQIRIQALAHAPNSFENTTNGVYVAGAVVEGWKVTANQVAVVADVKEAHTGTNFLALANGRITKTFQTKQGSAYQFRYQARGPGIIDWWPGDGNANDIIGANNGVLRNVNFESGMVNQAFKFKGDAGNAPQPSLRFGVPRSFGAAGDDDNEVDFGASAGNFGTGDFTIDFWIKQPPSATGLYAVLDKRPICQATISQWNIRCGPVNYGPGSQPGQLDFELSGNSHEGLAHYIANRSINDGLFHHAAFIRNGTTLSLYIDGLLDQSITTSGIANLANATVCRAGQSACVAPGVGGIDETRPFQGDLDELDFFNRALSPAEITAIFQAGSAGKANTVSPFPNFQVIVVGNLTNTLILTNAAGPWQPFANDFVASNSETTIEFSGHALGALLDDIQLSPLSAPPTR